MVRILLVDDHAIVREGLKQILEGVEEMHVSDEAGTAHEALEKIWKNNYDVVLLDISMPGRSGLDILKQIKTEKPQLKVLILSMHPEERYGVRALRAGASGYLRKESASDELITAIRKVTTGGKYVNPSLAEALAFHLDTDFEKPPHDILSDREYEVLCRIASGRTVKEIAKENSLSEKTISTYRARILNKMHMRNNSEMTYYAIKNELVG